MVSQTRPRDADTEGRETGLRRMDPARDFAAIARLIEVAFAEELSPGGHLVMRDLRLLDSFRPLLWLLSRAFPSICDFMAGYVWEENGRVIGNITVTRADGIGSQWIISNVAVLPAYRRQGIAHALMRAAIEHARVRGGVRILLQVRTDNESAKRLYDKLGFRYLESVTEMVCEVVRPSRLPVAPNITLREPVAPRWEEAYEVALAAIPLPVQQMRPLRPHAFRVRERSLLERVRDGIFGPARERWWVEVDGRVRALLTIDRQTRREFEQVEILIHPYARGLVENALVNQLTHRLHGRRGVKVTIAAELAYARAQLREAGFHELRTLDQMALELSDY